jgi:hypothetical protein
LASSIRAASSGAAGKKSGMALAAPAAREMLMLDHITAAP